MIKKETIDRIMDAARIEEVIGDVVKLKKRGANLLGLCPFHDEKTPSFTVSPAKEFFKCFGCGKSGNVVGFVMEHDALSYPEALRYLAGKYNIEVEETVQTAAAIEERTTRDSVYIVLKAAQEYFAHQLEEEEGKSIGLSYFNERGLRKTTIEQFGLGWAPKAGVAFVKWAEKNGYQKEYILGAGLANEGKDGRLFDRFQERVMFPIFNLTGKTIGFGGRIIRSDSKMAKYINSPETEVYDKSKSLFGIFQAKTAIRQQDQAIVVEGYMDVISLHQAGIQNVVASSGTSLTEHQLRLIKRFTDNVILFFDGDDAGRKAALRGIDLALAQGMNPKVALLPPEEDPDTFARKNNEAQIREFLEKEAQDFLHFKRGMLIGESTDPLKRTHAAKEILRSVALIPDQLTRASYLKESARLLEMEEDTLYQELRKILVGQYREERRGQQDPVEALLQDTPPPQPVIESTRGSAARQEDHMIRILVMYGNRSYDGNRTVAQYLTETLQEIEWHNDLAKHIFHEMEEAVKQGGEVPDFSFFINAQDQKLMDYVSQLVMEDYELAQWERFLGRPVLKPEETYLRDIQSSLLYLRLHKILHLVEENLKELQAATEPGIIEELQLTHMALLSMKRELTSQINAVVV